MTGAWGGPAVNGDAALRHGVTAGAHPRAVSGRKAHRCVVLCGREPGARSASGDRPRGGLVAAPAPLDFPLFKTRAPNKLGRI